MNKTWAVEMAWLEKPPATKVDDVSSIPRSDMIGKGNYFHKLFSDLDMHALTHMCAQTHTTCSGDRHSKPGRRREASRFSSYRNAPTLGWGATVCFIPVVWDRILLFKPGWLSVSNLLPWPVIVGLRKCIIKSTYF